MRNWGRVILLAGAVVLGVWLWGVWFPSPEKVIRARLREIEELVSFPANQPPLSALTEVQQLCARLSPDVAVHLNAPGFGRRDVRGRDTVREGAMAFRSTVNGASVKFPDIKVNLAPDKQSAEVLLTVEARVATEPDVALQEMKLTFQKLDGAWLIARVETVKTLR